MRATTTTKTIDQEPIEEKKIIIEKPKDDMSCGDCGKKIVNFVVANGVRFCNDDCLNHYISKRCDA